MDQNFLHNLRSLAEALFGIAAREEAFYGYQAVFTGSGQSAGTVAAISGTVPGLASAEMNMLDKVFVPTHICFSVYQSGAAVLRPLVLLQGTASQDNQPWFSTPVPIWSVAGDGYQPSKTMSKRRLQPRSKISWNVENYAAAAVDQVRLIMFGYHE